MAQIKHLLVLAIVFFGHMGFSQKDRYMVFFSDKEGVSFSIDQPEAFLSERAVSRRARMGIAITERDLPVNASYVAGVRNTGAEVYYTSRWFNAALVQMTSEELSQVTQLTFVDSVEYIAKGEKLSDARVATANVAEFKAPSRVTATTRAQLGLIGADEMHADGYKGEGMIIAVFDDGFMGVNEYEPFEHIFIEDRLLGTKDFISNSGNVFQYDDHGSAVLSCIASSYGADISGTAPNATFLLCVTEDIKSEYRIEEYNWLLAAEYADSAGADVINGSLGYSTFSDKTMNYSYQDMNGQVTVVSRAAEIAVESGIIVVVSAGNEGNGSWKYVTSPADATGVLAVGSVNPDGSRSSFSSVGPTSDGRVKPDVMAMGSFTTIFYVSGDEGVISTGNGTSFASPQMAGYAAGIWQANPGWSNREVTDAIKKSANRAFAPDSLYGYGIPHYPMAVTDTTFKVYPNPFRDNIITINFGNLEFDNKVEISLYDLQGKELYLREISTKSLPRKLEIEVNNLRSGTYFLSLRSRKFKKTVQLKKI
ncbi:S8 family serine peptidase [Marinoscillum sp.]|uniref:S8 family serine peptidase n=1 Tax=Marinoscillum sp. TaxID=2024838 RepID=UPI003BA9C1FD